MSARTGVARRWLLLFAVVVALVVGFAPVGEGRAAALSPSSLLNRYQPVTVLHPDELFPPVAVDSFLGVAQLEQRLPDGTWSPAVGQPPGILPTADPSGCTSTASSACWRLNIPGCVALMGVESLPCYRDLEQARPHSNVVYGAVLHSGDRIILEYWYWYWYDFWSGTFPPTDYVWQAHEGDWEMVAVLLTSSGQPVSVGYSQHSCGKVRSWSKVPKWPRTNHPLVYVALGTHANYFSARPIQIDLRAQCYSPLGAAILRHYLPQVLDYTGRGERFGPRLPGVTPSRVVRVTAHSPQWMNFPGYWGEINLFHAPDPIGTRIAGPAPQTPTLHAIWTNPLATLRHWPRG